MILGDSGLNFIQSLLNNAKKLETLRISSCLSIDNFLISKIVEICSAHPNLKKLKINSKEWDRKSMNASRNN